MKIPFLSERKGTDSGGLDQNGEAAAALAGADFRDDADDVKGLCDLYSPEPAGSTPEQPRVRDVADVLLESQKLTAEQHQRLRQEQSAKPGLDTGTWLMQNQGVDGDDVLAAKAQLCNMEFRRVEPEEVQRSAFDKLDVEFIRQSGIVPIRIDNNVLVVATSEPSNVFALDEVKRHTQMELQVFVCSPHNIDDICEAFREEPADCNLDEIISDMTDVEVVQDSDDESEDLEQMAGQSPVIKFVNYLISNAIREGASDIHIEPKDKTTKIRYRIDGMLFEAIQAPSKMHPAIVSRIKIMANLDISERRLPQDGKISVIVGGRTIDLRISTLPTSQGEKTVIRVLDSASVMLGMEHLGMEPTVEQALRDQIALPHGILLVTGPTGSGKSTTLYAGLCQMDGQKLNISTVEDPVEYELDFCNQVQANEKIGLTFATALRSFLRQDPDVIMVGEIRDPETARIAVQAALTGHLVLSTLHTNDAASSVTRLVNIGIDEYLIAASLNAVLAQRLVRKICPKCKQPCEAPEPMRPHLERAGIAPHELFQGAGCEACRGSGYVGRVGIFELLIVNDLLRDMISRDASVSSMRRAFMESGQASLFDDGLRKIKEGVTTLEEVLRVTEANSRKEDTGSSENHG